MVLLVASANGSVGMEAGWAILSSGGSALDAVEAATREVEDNPDDHSVGYDGYPNLLGTVELDASLMDGATRRAGTVGAVHGYRHPITIARAVLDRLPHVMVVGQGAERLASELGMQPEELLTEETRQVWRDGVDGRLEPNDSRRGLLDRISTLFTDPEHVAGTVNFLAIDGRGHIASAVSTSGWAWKYPGRLGDSPVIGAGNYCDDRYGAAACTGWGELAIRGVTAHSVVGGLAHGLGLEASAERAIADLSGLDVPGGEPIMQLVAIDRAGHHVGLSTHPGNTYVAWESGQSTFTTLPRRVVSLSG
ncbi:MAG: isoaspartyl peptidase/L-asparaginase [Candidatus Dormibacteria bacterium]|jgi:beta-aspartyl-peptidase (threonine type)